MHLKRLRLRNFRIYEEAVFEFFPKTNVIRGPNAKGKTSILEAIYVLMTGRSFRTSQISELVRRGASSFTLEAIFVKHGLENTLRLHYQGGERKVVHNSTAYSSSVSLLGLLQGSIVHPDDVAVVKGAPSIRRHLLDLQLAQADPLYVHYLTRYDRAMRQRNHLLRAQITSTIESWEYEMAHAAAYVIPQRAKAVSELQQQGTILYNHICGGKEQLSLLYKAHGTGDVIPDNSVDLCRLFCDQYARHRKKEMTFGATLSGPHKDDLIISLDDKEARSFASEGQQRSCVVALRLAEWERLKDQSYDTPLMLMDDIGMSLDSARRRYLLEHFNSLEQVFVTTTDELPLLDNEHTIVL